MKGKILSFTTVLVLSLGIMLVGFSSVKAQAVQAYVNTQYLTWDTRYQHDRSGIGHYLVNLNDPSSYLNVRDQPSTTSGNIIGRLYNGESVTTDMSRFFDPNWALITSGYHIYPY